MPPANRIAIDVHLGEGDLLAAMPDEVRRGLTGTPKSLPSKYFYDERGSHLFEAITHLPEYYLTRAESALLEHTAPKIAELTRPVEVLELGSGSARKTDMLLDAANEEGALERFLPFDVSRDIAERSTHRLAATYDDLSFHAIVGDFDKHLDRIPTGRRRLVAFLGSTIGNFEDGDASRFLRKVVPAIGDDGWFLLGTDLVKDVALLEAAYNDSRGVTAAFNLNILNVVNRHLDGNFDLDHFEHVAFYDRKLARMEAYVRSTRDQIVRLGAIDLDVALQQGEMIHTEVSCKYSRSSVERMLDEAGLVLEHWFTDADESYALSLSRLAPEHASSR